MPTIKAEIDNALHGRKMLLYVPDKTTLSKQVITEICQEVYKKFNPPVSMVSIRDELVSRGYTSRQVYSEPDGNVYQFVENISGEKKKAGMIGYPEDIKPVENPPEFNTAEINKTDELNKLIADLNTIINLASDIKTRAIIALL